jgi:hypothetical protein
MLKFIRGIFMSNIRELSFDEIASVSGGEGHGSEVAQDRRDARNSLGRNAPNKIYGGTEKCVNNILIGAGGGAITGGLPGAAVGLVSGAYAGECLSGGGNGNGNGCKAGSNNCSSGNAASTCNR